MLKNEKNNYINYLKFIYVVIVVTADDIKRIYLHTPDTEKPKFPGAANVYVVWVLYHVIL